VDTSRVGAIWTGFHGARQSGPEAARSGRIDYRPKIRLRSICVIAVVFIFAVQYVLARTRSKHRIAALTVLVICELCSSTVLSGIRRSVIVASPDTVPKFRAASLTAALTASSSPGLAPIPTSGQSYDLQVVCRLKVAAKLFFGEAA
jgi:hypothetical protein